MFKDRTVFILGAGASFHYGYPTGEMLVKRVIEKAAIAERFFGHSLRVMNNQLPDHLDRDTKDLATLWEKAYVECKRLKSGLEQVNPLVIDYYLGWNSDLHDIGRLLIAWVILECTHPDVGRIKPTEDKFFMEITEDDSLECGFVFPSTITKDCRTKYKMTVKSKNIFFRLNGYSALSPQEFFTPGGQMKLVAGGRFAGNYLFGWDSWAFEGRCDKLN